MAAGLAGALTARGSYSYVITKRDENIDIVARTLWGEARGEGIAGMQAVANVIANRVKAGGWFGPGWKEVCQKPYQFSTWNPGDPNRSKVLAVTTADSDFRMALAIATQAVDGVLADITKGALYYHADYVTPTWADPAKITAEIGSHVFYANA